MRLISIAIFVCMCIIVHHTFILKTNSISDIRSHSHPDGSESIEETDESQRDRSDLSLHEFMSPTQHQPNEIIHTRILGGSSSSSSYPTKSYNSTTSEHTSSHHPPLYGALSSLNIFIGTMSIIIIVFSVLFVEEFFEKLNKLTNETPFQELLLAIEKELMVVGTMAFIFKMILNLKLVSNSDWLIALEYAGQCFIAGYPR